MKDRNKLSGIKIAGFKSISSTQHAQDISFGDITVIIGANGAGKSNMVSFFKMLNMMCTSALQE
jgi:predicted ATPase